jgi:dethiobiotin synthetase
MDWRRECNETDGKRDEDASVVRRASGTEKQIAWIRMKRLNFETTLKPSQSAKKELGTHEAP